MYRRAITFTSYAVLVGLSILICVVPSLLTFLGTHRIVIWYKQHHATINCTDSIPHGQSPCSWPLSILTYINGMPDTIRSNISLFEDDTIMYLPSQTNLTVKPSKQILFTWKNEWLMSFDPDKCEVIRIINQKPIDHNVHLNVQLWGLCGFWEEDFWMFFVLFLFFRKFSLSVAMATNQNQWFGHNSYDW